DDGLFCRGDDECEGSRSGEGHDQGTDRAVGGSHLQGKGARSRMVGGSVMRTRAIAAAAALIVTTGAAHAAEVDAMITTAMKAGAAALAPRFERANGHVPRTT